MRNLINLKIKSKLNFRIHKLNEKLTLSNINCDKEKKNFHKKIQLGHIDVHS